MTHQTNGQSADECGLNNFERNHYFHGKLMTARDMRAEQSYHRNQLRTLARHVAGRGVVCGLGVEVESDEEILEVTVSRGMAIDCCGRPVVVPHTDTQEVNVAGDSTVWLSLEYDDCVRETVPVPGSENACEDACEYNRVVETFTVAKATEAPDARKPVRDVSFPEKDDFEDPDDPAGTEDAFREIAASYATDEEGEPRECDHEDGSSVLLGKFERDDDGDWARADDDEGSPRVYTNDLLYAAVARHSARFDNPHEVDAEQVGAIESVAGVHNDGGDVDLRSKSQDLLTIEGHDGDDEVTFEFDDTRIDTLEDDVEDLETDLDGLEGDVGDLVTDLGDLEGDLEDLDGEVDDLNGDVDDLEDAVETLHGRLSSMEFQLAMHSLEMKELAFQRLENCVEGVDAGELLDEIETAISDLEDNRDGEGGWTEVYLDALLDIWELEDDLELPDELRECDVEAYEGAVDELGRLVEPLMGGEEPEWASLAYAQNRVSMAAGWLTSGGQQVEGDQPPDLLGDKRDTFESVGDTFETRPAYDVVVETVEAINGEYYRYEPVYRDFFDDVGRIERAVLADLLVVDPVTHREAYVGYHPGLGDYAVALQELFESVHAEDSLDAIEDDQREVVAAAGNLQTDQEDDEVFNPRPFTNEEIEAEMDSVNDLEAAKLILAIEITGEHRRGASNAILDRVRELQT